MRTGFRSGSRPAGSTAPNKPRSTPASKPAPPTRPAAAPAAAPVSEPAAQHAAPRRRTVTRIWALAASFVLVAGVGLGVWAVNQRVAQTEVAEATLSAFPSHPDAEGTAIVEEQADGSLAVRVALNADAAPDTFREVWLITADASALVSLGVLEGTEQTFAVPAICRGGAEAGPIGMLPSRGRFRWLVSPRSTIIQPSEVHTGKTADPARCLDHLMDRVVRREGGSRHGSSQPD